jgi:predicted nucleic acid-binding protein
MIFVDTSAWFAFYSLRDINHAAAVSAFRSIREPPVTSDYIVDETLTLLRARAENRRAVAFGHRMMEGLGVSVLRISDQDYVNAWHVFLRFQDKAWSFTDCTSRVVMERLGIQRAFAFDDHFRQFGTVAIVP